MLDVRDQTNVYIGPSRARVGVCKELRSIAVNIFCMSGIADFETEVDVKVFAERGDEIIKLCRNALQCIDKSLKEPRSRGSEPPAKRWWALAVDRILGLRVHAIRARMPRSKTEGTRTRRGPMRPVRYKLAACPLRLHVATALAEKMEDEDCACSKTRKRRASAPSALLMLAMDKCV